MKDIKGIIARTGRWSLVIVILIIVCEHWAIMNLSQFPIPLNWLYFYLLVNGAAASPFVYLEHRRVKPKVCPQCDNPLHIKTSYFCLKCGDLQFKKKDDEVS